MHGGVIKKVLIGINGYIERWTKKLFTVICKIRVFLVKSSCINSSMVLFSLFIVWLWLNYSAELRPNSVSLENMQLAM